MSYLSRSLVAKCAEELSASDALDKGIPDVTAKTIAFLKKRGKCRSLRSHCGECLKEGTKEWAELEKLLEFVPPKSLGSCINDFLDEAKQTKALDLMVAVVAQEGKNRMEVAVMAEGMDSGHDSLLCPSIMGCRHDRGVYSAHMRRITFITPTPIITIRIIPP